MKDMSGDSLEGRNGSARAPGLNGNLRVPATTPAANETLGGAGREVLEDLPARVEAVYLGDGGVQLLLHLRHLAALAVDGRVGELGLQVGLARLGHFDGGLHAVQLPLVLVGELDGLA